MLEVRAQASITGWMASPQHPRPGPFCLLAALTAVALPATAGAGVQNGPLSEVHERQNVKVASASRSRFSIATQSPANGSTVSGTVTWQAQVSGTGVSRVDFSVDGSVRSSDSSAPYAYAGGLDTTALSNGSHTLTATAYNSHRTKLGSTSVVVTVQNSTPSPVPQPTPTPTPAPTPDADPRTGDPAPEPEPTPAPAAKPGSIYWGAWIGDQLTGNQAPWDMNAVTKFEQLAGKNLSIVNFSAPFANCSSSPCSFYNFPATEFNSIRSHGAIPLFSWGSQSIPLPSNLSEPNFQLSDLISGRYDTFIRSFATAAKNWGHPFFLRFNWEMNGNWFAWMEGVNGNQTGESVTAWRHVHDIFTEVGATNAKWVWCPNVDPDHRFRSLSSVYPGDAVRRLDRPRRLQRRHEPEQVRPLAHVRPALQVVLRTDRQHDRPLEADDGQRGRLHRVRRLEGDLDQGNAELDPGQTTRRSAAWSGSTRTKAGWIGRSRARPARRAPSPKASRTRPTRATSSAPWASPRSCPPADDAKAICQGPTRTNVQPGPSD